MKSLNVSIHNVDCKVHIYSMILFLKGIISINQQQEKLFFLETGIVEDQVRTNICLQYVID